jgi:hypothetical protein
MILIVFSPLTFAENEIRSDFDKSLVVPGILTSQGRILTASIAISVCLF